MSLSPAAPAPRYEVADRPPRRLADVLLRWESILVFLLIAVFFVNTRLSPYFFDFYNLSDATFNFSEKAILALAMALLIIVRDIDLSIAAIIALCSLAMGLAAKAGAPTPALIGLGLSVGTLCGAFNGALVTAFSLPSIVVTIGTMSLFRGIAQVTLGDQALTQYPASFEAIGQGYISNRVQIPISFVAVSRPCGGVRHCAAPNHDRQAAVRDGGQSDRGAVLRHSRQPHSLLAVRADGADVGAGGGAADRAHRFDAPQHRARLRTRRDHHGRARRRLDCRAAPAASSASCSRCSCSA